MHAWKFLPILEIFSTIVYLLMNILKSRQKLACDHNFRTLCDGRKKFPIVMVMTFLLHMKWIFSFSTINYLTATLTTYPLSIFHVYLLEFCLFYFIILQWYIEGKNRQNYMFPEMFGFFKICLQIYFFLWHSTVLFKVLKLYYCHIVN